MTFLRCLHVSLVSSTNTFPTTRRPFSTFMHVTGLSNAYSKAEIEILMNLKAEVWQYTTLLFTMALLSPLSASDSRRHHS
ncbi:hypothetical protein M501DRAFT_186837 [Patellaria atrata CBS 101060]|uniref:Uncharacterized protein n=1 Tax=Patellaria atrata CBS 101060 TaxID=1346257 RepID=A0A9P4S7R2_9PEZI|nr:hypothetical protein M501DRAFT_186837 [Patellaria atrata CBS 101060]